MDKRPSCERLESRRLLAADWQNVVRIRDVDADGLLTPSDVLVGIDRINQNNADAVLPVRGPESSEPFYDVNGDGVHTPSDLLLVINALNGHEPVVVQLSDDSGLAGDNLTNDAAIAGELAEGMTRLLGKASPQHEWADLTEYVLQDGSFEISENALTTKVGLNLVDGPKQIFFSAVAEGKSERLADAIPIEFQIDKARPVEVVAIGELSLPASRQIPVRFSEPLDPSSLVPEMIQLYDITHGDEPEGSPWRGDGVQPRLPIVATEIKLSPDGTEVLVTPPVAFTGTRYLVEVRGGLTDIAGNPVQASVESPAETRASFSAATAPLVNWGDTIRSLATLDNHGRVDEYRLQVEQAERLLWSGDYIRGSLTTYELYDSDGVLLDRLAPGTIANPGPNSTQEFWDLSAGEYRLRALIPPGSPTMFRIYREAELTELPMNRSAGNQDVWPSDAYVLDLEKDERLSFQPVIDDGPVVRSIVDARGRLQDVYLGPNGNEHFDAPEEGRYYFIINRVGHRAERSIPKTLEAQFGELVTVELESPGQRFAVKLETVPGEQFAVYNYSPEAFRIYKLGASEQASSLVTAFYAENQQTELVIESTQAETDGKTTGDFVFLSTVGSPVIQPNTLQAASELPFVFRFPADALDPFSNDWQFRGAGGLVDRWDSRFGLIDEFELFRFDPNSFAIVYPTNSPWEYGHPIVRQSPEPVGETISEFEFGYQINEYSVPMERGELIGLNYLSLPYRGLSLFDPAGREVGNLSSSRVLYAPVSGIYKLRLQSGFEGTPVTFEISKSSDWETIQPDIPYSFDIEHREFQYMKFPKGVAFPANLVGVSLFRLSEVGNSGVRSGLYDDYYLELNNWNAKDIVWTNPQWIEPPELNGEEIEIGQLINIPMGTADPISYRFELQEATEIIFLRNRNGVFQRHSGAATVIASDGKERQLDSLETLFLDAGRYAIRVWPDGSLESSFQLLDVGEARTVRSDTWLDLPPGPERYELLRLEIEDGREHFLEISGGGRAVFFDDPHGSLPYVLTKGGLVAIFTDAASRVGLVSVEGRTRTFELPDGSFSGEFFLGREVHRYRFRITEPGYYSVYARNAGSQPLELEPGISIPWRMNASLSQIVGETETLFSNVPDQPELSFLPAGEFELKISTNLDYGVYEAGVEVVEFTDVAFGQTMMIEDGTNYRFQLDFEEGFVAARVADEDGQSVPPQSVFLRNENRILHPGPLEIVNLQRQHLIWKSEFSGELNGPIQLRLSPLDASTGFSEAARLLPAMLNRTETVQLTALDYETVLRYTVPERDTVLLLRADLSPETQLHFRFVSASGDDVLPDWQDWSAFESQFWLDPESVLEIRFAGTGTSVLELGNLASATAISSGVHPFTLPANYESRVWKLPDQVGTIVEFDADEHSEETRWQILDAHGRVVRDFKHLPSLVIRDSGGYYLSMIRESPGNQPFTQTLSVQIVGPDERPG